VTFNSDNALPNLAGPGTIDPVTTTITYDNGGPYYLASWALSAFMDTAEASIFPLAWGSFAGGTNDVVVYPNGTSIAEFEYFRSIQITPTPPFLPGASVGVLYSQQLTAVNAQAPVTWTFAPTSPDLPGGLGLTGDGMISGTPTTAGTYDFTLQMTDGGGRSINVAFTITISP
jgi:hypothetical protein